MDDWVMIAVALPVAVAVLRTASNYRDSTRREALVAPLRDRPARLAGAGVAALAALGALAGGGLEWLAFNAVLDLALGMLVATLVHRARKTHAA